MGKCLTRQRLPCRSPVIYVLSANPFLIGLRWPRCYAQKPTNQIHIVGLEDFFLVQLISRLISGTEVYEHVRKSFMLEKEGKKKTK
jgi:hypothetical protein